MNEKDINELISVKAELSRALQKINTLIEQEEKKLEEYIEKLGNEIEKKSEKLGCDDE